ncbi:MAG: redoxin domain-containing protein [Bacteroidota bacterium]
MSKQSQVLIANDTVSTLSVLENNQGMLWIKASKLKAATGFELKASGACYDPLNICIPIFEDDFIKETANGKWLNVSKLADKLGQACVADESKKVWSLGILPEIRKTMLESANAPDFEIADIHGQTVRLSDFRGKKVLIVTWATWCGCRFDVKVWQRIYEELNDPNFEIISVAEDSEGPTVARKWFTDAQATYKCVVDPTHKISTLFGWVNVPTAAWIDETGKIVRINEAAYAAKHTVPTDKKPYTFGGTLFGKATIDWVKNGLSSHLKQSVENRIANTRSQSADDLLADAYFKLGLYFEKQGDLATAQQYWDKAMTLAPHNWNIHRQSWTFTGTDFAIAQWKRKNKELYLENKGYEYYKPLDIALK